MGHGAVVVGDATVVLAGTMVVGVVVAVGVTVGVLPVVVVLVLVLVLVLACVISFKEAFSVSSCALRASGSEESEHATTNTNGINKISNRFTF